MFACCASSFFRMRYNIPVCGFTFMCLSTFSLKGIISWFFLLWVLVTYLQTHKLWFPGGTFILFLIPLFPKVWCIHISIRIDVCLGSLGHADVSRLNCISTCCGLMPNWGAKRLTLSLGCLSLIPGPWAALPSSRLAGKHLLRDQWAVLARRSRLHLLEYPLSSPWSFGLMIQIQKSYRRNRDIANISISFLLVFVFNDCSLYTFPESIKNYLLFN